MIILLDGTGLYLGQSFFLLVPFFGGAGLMASFREQMQRLADNIARTRNERKAFLDRNQKECTRKRRELNDQRNQIKTELEKEAKALSKQLSEFKRNNQRTVEKTLRELRNVRVKAAKSAKTLLKQEIIRNRRDIVRMLRQNNNDRMRAARQQDRASATTIQSVRSQVQRIRVETKRMTKSWSKDRNDARQIWTRLQSSMGVRRETGFVSRAIATPLSTSATPEPIAVMESVIQRPSGLPVPPSVAVHALT